MIERASKEEGAYSKMVLHVHGMDVAGVRFSIGPQKKLKIKVGPHSSTDRADPS